MKSFLYILLFCLIGFELNAQNPPPFYPNNNIEIYHNNELLKLPFTGGLNSPQFSDIDLDNDGIKDLVVFENTINKVLTFKNNGTPNTIDYIYEPQFESLFPEIENWMLLVDYNNDGLEDLFTRFISGIRLYKASYDNDKVIFTLEVEQLLYTGNSGLPINVFVSPGDIPAIIDMNNDGDIDVLSFDLSGAVIEYYENQSVENNYIADSLYFEKVNGCWGNVFEDPNNDNISLNISCKSEGSAVDSSSIQLHVGSTLLAFDQDGDGDKELIVGDKASSNLSFLLNDGDENFAEINYLDVAFPSTNISAQVFIFPAAFYVDVDNDGLEDLIVAPFEIVGAENHNQVLLYKNTGTTNDVVFEKQQNDFLVREMIDAGKGAYPKFVDVDGDELLDIVIGNVGYFQVSDSTLYSTLTVYKNISTANQIAFELSDMDFNNLSTYNLEGIFPTFADFDGDEDLDMIAGDEQGYLNYFENIGSSNEMILNLHTLKLDSITVGTRAVPTFYDYNDDGLIDLVVGERSGNLNLLENISSAGNLQFELINNFWGGVNVQVPPLPIGNSAPIITELDSTETNYLLSNNFVGSLFLYNELEANNFNKLDTFYSGTNTGGIGGVDVADLNSDGFLDLVVGNDRGGITILTQDEMLNIPPVVGIPNNNAHQINIYPNPAQETIFIETELKVKSTSIHLVNSLGQVIKTFENQELNSSINIAELPKGIYFISIAEHQIFKRFVKY